tara:strand:- start:5609 stop:6073 length:465 start_codon:yes stop_codon:yes gene_type:complete
MALNVVTGIGPRVGSSFVMQQCKENKLEVNGTKFLGGILPKEGNPKGYYDLFPWDVSTLQHGIAKVWPIQLHSISAPVNRMVILKRRDLTEQINSCLRQIEREPFDIKATPEEIITMSDYKLNKWLSKNKVDHCSYYTEDLDSSIDEIIKFLGD